MENTKRQIVPFWILWTGIIFLNVFILVVTSVSAVLLKNEMNVVFTHREEYINSTKKHISYYNTMTIVEDQEENIPSWIYALVGFIESSYRKNGLEKGYLNETEYVRLDEKQIFNHIQQLCTSKPCQYCQDVMYNGSPELFYYLYKNYGEELIKGIVPKDYSGKLENNPIKLEITKLISLYNKDDVREMMRNTQLPMTLTFGTYDRRYAIPCENDFGYVCPENITKSPCPASIGGECNILDFNPYSKGGVYDYTDDLHYKKKHSVLVVGWNDEKRIDRSWGTSFHNFYDGGYVVKNSYGYKDHGHTINYWLQEHSLKSEAQVCPNIHAFESYLPLSEDCIKSHTYEECCEDYIKKGVHAYIKETITQLICDGTKDAKYEGIFKCDPQRIYFIKAKSNKWGPFSGSDSMDIVQIHGTNMFKINLLSFTQNMTDMQHVTISPCTQEMLEDIFMTKISEVDKIAASNTEECGYDFIPFKVLEKYNENYVIDGLHSAGFSMFEIKWNDQSYAASQTVGLDYTAIKNATNHVYQTEFVGAHEVN